MGFLPNIRAKTGKGISDTSSFCILSEKALFCILSLNDSFFFEKLLPLQNLSSSVPRLGCHDDAGCLEKFFFINIFPLCVFGEKTSSRFRKKKNRDREPFNKQGNRI
ncbi:hypothetical protein CDAR_310731 [Caerostris darwini]|uniref:Uncharacterized protein n=1 Tax=Caerostris darwini TaxID=1538125 RepID=A0AAV4VR63_9ARAC|nr:hypothetical protein CDAR_310731 [Caerostris darwini]